MTGYKAHKLGSLFASIVLAGSLLAAGAEASSGGSAVQFDRKSPVHPLLQYAAQVSPDRKIRVLVRKDRGSADSQSIAMDADGTVKEDFHITKTFVTEVTARKALKLAENKHVQYVAPDAKMRLEQISTGALLSSYPATIGLS